MSARKVELTVAEEYIYDISFEGLALIVQEPLKTANYLKCVLCTIADRETLPAYLQKPTVLPWKFLYDVFQNQGFSYLFTGLPYTMLRYVPQEMGDFAGAFLVDTFIPNGVMAGNTMFAILINHYIKYFIKNSIRSTFCLPLDFYKVNFTADLYQKRLFIERNPSWLRLFAGLGSVCALQIAHQMIFQQCYRIGFVRRLHLRFDRKKRKLLSLGVRCFADIVTSPLNVLALRQIVTNESIIMATRTLYANHGITAFFHGFWLDQYQNLQSLVLDGVKENLKDKLVEHKKYRIEHEKVDVILRYRQQRNEILYNLMDRADWMQIVNDVICVYLDRHMQNQYIYHLGLTDKFAISQGEPKEYEVLNEQHEWERVPIHLDSGSVTHSNTSSRLEILKKKIEHFNE